jgi:hypothetical protein
MSVSFLPQRDILFMLTMIVMSDNHMTSALEDALEKLSVVTKK